MSDDELAAGDSGAGAATLPQNTVNQLLKELLKGRRCSADVNVVVHECLGEFLQMLTMQANEACTNAGKSTISESHIEAALKELGFPHYVPLCCQPAAAEASASGEGAKKARRGKRKQPPSSLSQEELLRMQQELFANARQSVEQKQGEAEAAANDTAIVAGGAGPSSSCTDSAAP